MLGSRLSRMQRIDLLFCNDIYLGRICQFLLLQIHRVHYYLVAGDIKKCACWCEFFGLNIDHAHTTSPKFPPRKWDHFFRFYCNDMFGNWCVTAMLVCLREGYCSLAGIMFMTYQHWLNLCGRVCLLMQSARLGQTASFSDIFTSEQYFSPENGHDSPCPPYTPHLWRTEIFLRTAISPGFSEFGLVYRRTRGMERITSFTGRPCSVGRRGPSCCASLST